MDRRRVRGSSHAHRLPALRSLCHQPSAPRTASGEELGWASRHRHVARQRQSCNRDLPPPQGASVRTPRPDREPDGQSTNHLPHSSRSDHSNYREQWRERATRPRSDPKNRQSPFGNSRTQRARGHRSGVSSGTEPAADQGSHTSAVDVAHPLKVETRVRIPLGLLYFDHEVVFSSGQPARVASCLRAVTPSRHAI